MYLILHRIYPCGDRKIDSCSQKFKVGRGNRPRRVRVRISHPKSCSLYTDARGSNIGGLGGRVTGHCDILQAAEDMSVKPTVALRAILVGGIAAFAKIAGAAKAAGGVKLGAAAAAVTAAASATMAGSKQEANQSTK
ncbi:hypothetical protein QVD17_02674 [Tagetes erecta]|uniref:Uncharacterized protein n=1 Tax=Tagetes erecta TaxID=13708 RepID=A0AAD8P2N2_TARER|nr:hypothetical protein QVD17_02674 [Tagetes erecta]